MKKLKIDIMTLGGAKFYRTLQYLFNPIFPLETKELEKWVNWKCPLLKYERNIVLFVDFPPELKFLKESLRIPFGSDYKIEFRHVSK